MTNTAKPLVLDGLRALSGLIEARAVPLETDQLSVG